MFYGGRVNHHTEENISKQSDYCKKRKIKPYLFFLTLIVSFIDGELLIGFRYRDPQEDNVQVLLNAASNYPN